jgi:hypothetical protein
MKLSGNRMYCQQKSKPRQNTRRLLCALIVAGSMCALLLLLVRSVPSVLPRFLSWTAEGPTPAATAITVNVPPNTKRVIMSARHGVSIVWQPRGLWGETLKRRDYEHAN